MLVLKKSLDALLREMKALLPPKGAFIQSLYDSLFQLPA